MRTQGDLVHDRLNNRIAELNRQGFGALNSTETSATLIKEKQPKHWLHLIAVLLTAGLWLFPYVYIIGKSRVKIYLEIEGAGLLRESREGGGVGALLLTWAVMFGAYIVLGVLAFLALPWLSWGASVAVNNSQPNAAEEACSAMNAADFIMDEIENDLYGGKRISVARINALIPTEERIRALLLSVEGDFQSYMSTQADNISRAFDDLKESAAPGSKPGVDDYMKVFNTDHLKYCQDE